jgi:hypothetical protein
MGGHALHATIREEVIGMRYLHEGRFVTPDEALDIAAEGGRIVERPVYQSEFFDPQNGRCVSIPDEVRAYIRFE